MGTWEQEYDCELQRTLKSPSPPLFDFMVRRSYRPTEVSSCHSVFIFFYQFPEIMYTDSILHTQ